MTELSTHSLDKNKSTQCNILCPLDISYNSPNFISYEPDALGHKFVFPPQKENDFQITFRKILYEPQTLLFIQNIKDTASDGPSINSSIIGYCLIIHENISNNNELLHLYIPLELSVSQSASQKIFHDLTPPQNVTHAKVEISLPENWNISKVFPPQKSFFWFQSQSSYGRKHHSETSHVHIVFEYPSYISQSVFDALKSQSQFPLENLNQLYYNNGSTVTGQVSHPKFRVKCQKVVRRKNIQLDKKCKEDDLDDLDDESDDDDEETKKEKLRIRTLRGDFGKAELTPFESRISAFFMAFLGIVFIFTFFKIKDLLGGLSAFEDPNNLSFLIFPLKIIGMLVWLPIHISYTYISRFGIGILYGIVYVCAYAYQSLKELLRRSTDPERLVAIKNAALQGAFDSKKYPFTSGFTLVVALIIVLSFFLKYIGYFQKTSNNTKKLCRNTVRSVGFGFEIDECYRQIHLEKYITHPKHRDVFKKEYLKAKKDGESAENALQKAALAIDKNYNLNNNYTKVIENVTYFYKFCHMYNDIISESASTRRVCDTQNTKNSHTSFKPSSCKIKKYDPFPTQTQQSTQLRITQKFANFGVPFFQFETLENMPKLEEIELGSYQTIRQDNLTVDIQSILNAIQSNTVQTPMIQLHDKHDTTQIIECYIYRLVRIDESHTFVLFPMLQSFPNQNDPETLNAKTFLVYTQFEPISYYRLSEMTESHSIPLYSRSISEHQTWTHDPNEWSTNPDIAGYVQYKRVLQSDPILSKDLLQHESAKPPVVTFQIQHTDKQISGFIYQDTNGAENQKAQNSQNASIMFKFDDKSKCLIQSAQNQYLRLVRVTSYDPINTFVGIPFMVGKTASIKGAGSTTKSYFQIIAPQSDTDATVLENPGTWGKNGPLQARLGNYYTVHAQTSLKPHSERYNSPIVRFQNMNKPNTFHTGFLFSHNGKVYLDEGVFNTSKQENNDGLLLVKVFNNKIFDFTRIENTDTYKIGAVDSNMKIYYNRSTWKNVDSGIYYLLMANTFKYKNEKSKGPLMEISLNGETFNTYFYIKQEDPLHVYMDAA